MAEGQRQGFYEAFWEDRDYTLAYAMDAARRERFPAIRAVWGPLPPPRRVLDYGCGNGALSARMFANGFGAELVGVDLSATAVASARERFAGPGLSFETLEPEHPLAALGALGAFDAVVCCHVLEHLAAPAEALAALRALAPWLVLEVPLERCLVQDALARLRARKRRDNPVGHVQFWDRAGFGRLLAEQGLEIVRQHHYAAAPFSPYTGALKRRLERGALALLGTARYGRLMATHYCVLARRAEGA